MTTKEHMPFWLMTPEQSGEITKLTRMTILRPEVLIDLALESVGDGGQTRELREQILWQHNWLEKGLPWQRAPYWIIHRRFRCNPFWGADGGIPQILMSNDAFIRILSRTVEGLIEREVGMVMSFIGIPQGAY